MFWVSYFACFVAAPAEQISSLCFAILVPFSLDAFIFFADESHPCLYQLNVLLNGFVFDPQPP
jgi:hypothetical protein